VLDCGDAAAGEAGASDGSGAVETGGALNEDSGLPNPLSDSCRRLAVTGSGGGACVLLSDGTVTCSGVSVVPGVQTIPNTSGTRCISGGEFFLCLVTSAGGVACWGSFEGTTQTSLGETPTPVPGLESGVIDIAAGETHACVLMGTGAVQCWGGSAWGEGNGPYNMGWPTSPTTVPLPSRAAAIASGDGFTCAILASGGQVECWGANQGGELGTTAPSDLTTPVQVGLPAPAVGIWADQATSPCALLQDGSVWCWGVTGQNITDSPPAPQTGFAAPVQALTTGGEWGMSCALLTTGAVQCWGYSESSLGDGNAAARALAQMNGEYSALPVNVLPAGSGAVEIRSGDSEACALLASGGVTCWGNEPVPTTLPGL
jgi:hypothetical protein